jgi:hypothetical protein
MNYRFLCFVQVLSCAFALKTVKNFAQKNKSAADWTEALDDFKTLVHIITFGEDIPSHQSNPLQVMIQAEGMKSAKNPFELPEGWFGKKKLGRTNKKKFNNKIKKSKKRKTSKPKNKNKLSKRAYISASQIREQQSIDDLALLNFLVQLEEPKSRAASIQSRQNKKNLISLINAENRYNEIKKKIGITPSKKIMFSESKKPRKSFSKIFVSKSDNQTKGKKAFNKNDTKNKKWFERIDMKGAKNTLTLSVAFGVIVTALFCVVVQLFKLFANSKGSGRSGAFEQINRRSTYGYDKIALDIEDDEENGQSN